MKLADHLMALTSNRDMLPNQYRHFYHSTDLSFNSSSSFSDEDSPPESVFADKSKDSSSQNEESAKLNRELATIFAANRLLSLDEKETPKKRNIYVQQRVKHSSGGSNGGKKVATAWKRITDRLGRPQSKSGKHSGKVPADFDAWRRFSLDTPPSSGPKKRQAEDQGPGAKPDLTRLLSLDTASQKPKEGRLRPRSNSVICHFKILSKNAETADFTVTEPSKLADASALCHEYFARLTCYDVVPHFTLVIAVDKMVPVSKAFNAFCDNSATSIVLWDSAISSMVSVCHADDLVCRLWSNARQQGCDTLFDVESDFGQPLVEFCSIPFMRSVPVDTSLIDAARFLCASKDDKECPSSKRLALIKSTNDIVHLLSAWDILQFFSEQVSKFHAAHTAFDRLTLESVLANQSESCREVEILPECKPLKEVIGSLAAKGGGTVVSRLEYVSGKQALVTLSFVDIIQYVVGSRGSWNEADATDNTLGDVVRYTQKESLVFAASTPLFAVLTDWIPSMTADMPVVVVSDCSAQTVLGLLQPEHLLQALLFDTAQSGDQASAVHMSSIGEIPVSTRL